MNSWLKNTYIFIALTIFAQAPLQATADFSSYSWWKIGTAAVATVATLVGGYLAYQWYSSRISDTVKAKRAALEKAALTNDTKLLQRCFEGNAQADANHMIKTQTLKSPFYHKDALPDVTLPVLAFFLHYDNHEAVEFLLTKNANPNITLSIDQELILLQASDRPFENIDYYNPHASKYTNGFPRGKWSGVDIKPLTFFSFVQVDNSFINNTQQQDARKKCLKAMQAHNGDFNNIKPPRCASNAFSFKALELIPNAETFPIS